MSEKGAPGATLSAAKLALAARQQRGSEAATLLQSEPIAVVGIGCRLPGGVSDPESYWTLLDGGMDAVRAVPRDRWEADALFDPERTAPGKITTREGAFLDAIDGFDPAFFGIAPREAAAMDPQQRLLLEVAWEALEDGGQAVDRLAGSATGVFVAAYNDDYARLLMADPSAIDAYTLSGTSHSIAAGRLSFLHDLRGPAIAVDTACSASLVAVHLACQSLRSGECHLALAGGVSLVLSPEGAISMARWGMLAPDGRSKAFDARADGFGRGEGCGVVVLKRLADALAAGDPVRAVIRGTAVNQDGRSAGLTAPNGLAQQAVVREALRNARVSPSRVSYVETHGTGTSLGDPIEVEALADVLGRDGSEPCALASVKTNIGHLEAAAGVAGLIKVVLALEKETLPKHLHFQRLNPHISLDGTRFFIPGERRPWPRGEEPRFAGVSSFGFGGTNAHVVLEEAPRTPRREEDAPRAELLPLSAHTKPALRESASRLARMLATTDASLGDVCYTAAVRRTHHSQRLTLAADTKEQARTRLEAFARGEAGAVREDTAAALPPRTVFVFSGQGPQWWAMGRELMGAEKAFREAVEACDAALRVHTGWSVVDELGAAEAESRLSRTEVAQPALFALQLGLTALWKSWGIAPHAVLGHSVGEIAAATTAGALDIASAARIAAHRGRLMQRATGLGRMAAIELPAAEVAALLKGLGERLSVAAENAPASTVVSGETEALEELLRALAARGIAHKRLPVDYAFHSAQMEALLPELARCLDGLTPSPIARPMVSTLTGEDVQGPELDAGYWPRAVRRPVRFAAAVRRLVDAGHSVFVEVSPHPVLGSYVADVAAAAEKRVSVFPSLRRGQPERLTLLASLGGLFALGAPVEWHGVHDRPRRCVPLPSYAWQRQRYWMPEARTAPARSGGSDTGHRLLGRRLRSPLREAQYESVVDPARIPYVADHRILGSLPLPATAMLDAALAAARQALGRACEIEEMAFEEPLLLDEGAVLTQLVVRPESAGESAELELFSQSSQEQGFTRHARGRARAAQRTARAAPDEAWPDLGALQTRLGPPREGASFYEACHARGLAFGPRFRAVKKLWVGENEILARIEGPEDLEASEDLAAPPLLDACLQAINAWDADGAGVYVPAAVGRVVMSEPLAPPLFSHVVARERRDGGLVVDVSVRASDGRRLATLTGLRLSKVARLAAPSGASPSVHEVEWRPADPPPSPASAEGTWLVVGGAAALAEEVAAVLGRTGATVSRVAGGASLDLTRGGIRGAVLLAPLEERIDETLPGPAVEASCQRVLGGALELVQALVRAEASRLLLVTRGAQAVATAAPVEPVQTALWGLRGVVALEHPELRPLSLDLDPAGEQNEAERLVEELLSPDDEARVARRAGGRLVARLVRRPAPPALSSATRAAEKLEPLRRGELAALRWSEAARRAPGAGEVEVEVRATGLNFRDVLNALGMYPGDPGPLGDECAGVVVAAGPGVSHLRVGDEVMGFAPGSFATHVTARAQLFVRRPKNLGLTAAAALPIAYLTAKHCLEDLAELRPGQTVLVHAAAGGVGLAAVEIARRRGAIVFGTAGSAEKRALLAERGVAQAFDSRSLTFADELMKATDGRGVDVVLNSLAGQFIEKSLAVVRPGGVFLEIGRTDVWSDEEVERLGRDIRYHVVFLGAMREEQPALVRAGLEDLVQRIEDGRLDAPTVRTFAAEAAIDAFRFMSQARHVGKIVVTRDAGHRLDEEALRGGTCLLTGGLGGVGLQLAAALVERGARHLALVGRTAPSPAAEERLEALRRAGARVLVAAADVGREDELKGVLAAIDEAGLPPLCGIVHAAGILDDGVLVEQSRVRFARALAGKALGAWNLHRLSAGSELRFFVGLSSIAAWLGWAGQGSYAAANAFLDGLAGRRRAAGLRATSVAWGPWAEAGMASRLGARDRARLEEHGLTPVAAARAAELTLRLAETQAATVAAMAVDWRLYAATAAPGGTGTFLADLAEAAPRREETGAPSLPAELAATPPARRRALLLRRSGAVVARILGLPSEGALDPDRPLRDLGLDSLMAVEIRNALGALLERHLPATLLFDQPTLGALADHLLGLVSAAAEPAAKESARPLAQALEEVSAISEADAEKALLEELEALGEEKRRG